MNNYKFDYLVFGANGQDGFFMTRYLLKKNYRVVAVIRRNFKYLDLLNKNFQNKLKIIKINNFNEKNYLKVFKNIDVNKIFFFAGFSKIPTNELEKKKCYRGNYIIFKLFLEFLIKKKLIQKILYISSSEIYGSKQKKKRNEKSIMRPDNYYGECKVKTQNLISFYRKKYSLFISTAIAYNHESIFTPKNHLITTFFNKFENSKNNKIIIYNPNDCRNISHVYDFLPVFEKILFLKKSGDFILANNIDYKLIDIIKIINKTFYKNKFIIQTSENRKLSISRRGDNTWIKKLFKYNPYYDIYKILKRFYSYNKRKVYK